MKTLGKLKLLVLSACIAFGMSSCLKSDNSLNIYVQAPYILQDNYGYTPQMRIQGSDPMQDVTLIVGSKTFKFTKLNDYFWELQDGIYSSLPQLDTIAAGGYSITAVGVDGKTASAQVGFTATDKKIGTINLAEFEYEASNSQVKIELADSVQNADGYYLMVKTPLNSTYTMWLPYSRLNLTGEKNLSAVVNSIQLEKDLAYRFAVGATYGTTFRISDREIHVTGGEEN